MLTSSFSVVLPAPLKSVTGSHTEDEPDSYIWYNVSSTPHTSYMLQKAHELPG